MPPAFFTHSAEICVNEVKPDSIGPVTNLQVPTVKLSDLVMKAVHSEETRLLADPYDVSETNNHCGLILCSAMDEMS
jgi:hypothetical protein